MTEQARAVRRLLFPSHDDRLSKIMYACFSSPLLRGRWDLRNRPSPAFARESIGLRIPQDRRANEKRPPP
eukprot:577200-Prorocentrum_lima.AAC.1